MKPYAGFWQRVNGFAYDYVIISIYLILITGLFALVNSSTSIVQKILTDRVSAQIGAFLIVTFPITLYFAIGESSSKQATWGKQRAGLSVEDHNGNRTGFWRALTRTLLKFVPWELSHTLIWEIYFSQGQLSQFINYGFALVYILIGLNIASLIMTKTHQTLYDFLAKTIVTR